MPRRERPLDPGDGPLPEFAADLRLLRQKAGSPTYRDLAQRAHFSSSTLADAAAGRKLPSLPVTLAYVRACDADPGEWETRWRETAAALATTREPVPDTDDGSCPYVGLAAFQPEDAARFHGRERLTDDLVARVRATPVRRGLRRLRVRQVVAAAGRCSCRAAADPRCCC